ncbi:HD domain-containing protein [Bacillus sp. DX4.1]|uniref:HD domain-containing protein n=1 Tax=Bacillus sp. DX4.1 TaxID=3055867 RepID=UPI0025A12D66|nr:HD domain-containing protein [Bacillus sp. DX4.1]MDM5188904.1 HD domain-containing protein [Bacillus sp. DX4.1]
MKIIDPIYETININDKDILNLIETNAFQRLSYIKQQGHTYFLHPNAVHSRIEHSIGVYELMNKVIDHLTVIGDIDFSLYERKLATVAGLLHDIGHGPFSHCFQRISGQDHGDWTIRIIQEDKEVRSILERTSGLLEDVVKILLGEDRFPIIEEMMFLSLGMDQLDFWNRDLHYSSLRLDRIPIEQLISTMRYIDHTLVIEEVGIPYIEHLIKVKKSLYDNGFGHPFVVGKDLLLQSVFKKIKEHQIPFYNSLLQIFFHKREEELKVEDFLPLTDEVIYNEMHCFARSENMEIAQLSKLYISTSQSLQWMEGIEGDFNGCKREEDHIFGIITEKKSYSSYTGGIYINRTSHFEDVLQASHLVREVVHLPTKEYMYFLKER